MMPMPSLSALIPTELRLLNLRVPQSLGTFGARRHYSPPRVIRQASIPAARGSRIPLYNLIVQRNKMSTTADHKPLKQAPKSPPVPRPSARYVELLTSYSDHKRYTKSSQCPRHLSHQPNITSSSCLQSLQLRIRACLPWRRTKQDPRR
jgi:hypothetical protein